MKAKWMVIAALVLSMMAFTACGKKQEPAEQQMTKEEAVKAAEEAEAEALKQVEEVDKQKEEFLKDFTGEMDLAGSWQDEVSQRATMDAEKNEDGSYHIVIHWAGSATEAAVWEINGTYDETSGMLAYEDGSYTIHTWDDQDNETVSEAETTEGSLMKEGEKLRWSDSKNENDGLFVKVSE